MATKKKNRKDTEDNTYDPLRAHDIRYLCSIGYSPNEAKRCLDAFGCVRNMAGALFCFDPKSSRESD